MDPRTPKQTTETSTQNPEPSNTAVSLTHLPARLYTLTPHRANEEAPLTKWLH